MKLWKWLCSLFRSKSADYEITPVTGTLIGVPVEYHTIEEKNPVTGKKVWVAVAVGLDVVGQGDSERLALDSLYRTLEGYSKMGVTIDELRRDAAERKEKDA
jgi:hypothetical protein